jgi:NADPH:quinone reductase-like Zn-dependent oxidoreductase
MAEYAAFPESDLVAVPNTVSNEDAAQFFCKCMRAAAFSATVQ